MTSSTCGTDTEHMQERVLVPGFIAASRYRALSGARQYCALYRTLGIDVFQSEAYRQRLAAQSDWSRRVLKTFVDPHRSVGRIGRSLGSGTGGFIALLKLPRQADGGLDSVWRNGVANSLAGSRNMIAVSLFESNSRLSGPVAEYRPTTRPIMASDDHLLILEASQPSVLSAEHLAGVSGPAFCDAEHLGVYSLSWQLARQDLP